MLINLYIIDIIGFNMYSFVFAKGIIVAKNLIVTTIRLDQDDHDRISQFAKERKIPIGALLRGMIKDSLSGIDRKQEALLQANENLKNQINDLLEEMRICTQMSAAGVAISSEIGANLLVRPATNESAEITKSRQDEFKSKVITKSFRGASDITGAYQNGILENRKG